MDTTPLHFTRNSTGSYTAETDERGGTRYTIRKDSRGRGWSLKVQRTRVVSTVTVLRDDVSADVDTSEDTLKDAKAVASEYAARAGQSSARLGNARVAAYRL